MTPALTFVFEARVEVGTALEMGQSSEGRHRIIPITGGVVTGPMMNGKVLEGGADWQRIRPDGVAKIEARYAIETDDGVIVSIINRGIRTGPADVMARLAAGEEVDPASYYFRTTPEFKTGAKKYEWLTRSVFIASGERQSGYVLIRFFRVE